MGAFYSKEGRPFFSPDTKQEFEIKTDATLGPRFEVEPNPTELEPNCYYNFGTVSSKIKITRLKTLSPDHLETYEGEFTIGSGGSVEFPKVVRWVVRPNFSEVGSTYQFLIKNGIGTFIEVK